MAYYPFPLQQLITAWEQSGGSVVDLIEPVDGFHPSQTMNALLGDYMFKLLLQDYPDFLGPVNPNNAAITAKFGDQGGY
jgi:acyloxyacyl hydrolase